jgi:hypothetical protein
MIINSATLIQLLNIIFFCGIFSFQSFGQKPKLKSISWRDNWKLEIKTGAGALLSPGPDKYLEKINYVNIPLYFPGPLGIFSIKKSIRSHLEMGYQFDYMRIQGKVDVGSTAVRVLTQAYTHTYLIKYNLKKTNEFKPLLNYFLYYKIGGISLKNNPLDKLPEGTSPNSPDSGNKFISNVAVLTGIGAGINYQLNNNFSLIGSFDLNRSSDAIEDIYQIHKLFYHSSHSVNSYIILSFGLAYNFNFAKQKKSIYYKSRTETERHLIQSKIARRKGKSSAANHSIWYDYKRGI